MYNLTDALNILTKGISETLSVQGFKPIVPEGLAANALPLFEEPERKFLEYKSEKGKIRIVYANDLISLLYTDVNADEADSLDLKIASQSLFPLNTLDEKDIKSVCNEFNDDIKQFFGTKEKSLSRGKNNTPVSKSQAKSGAMQYDANTLASRLTTPYPELKEAYKENLEKYGEFLGEEFFVEHGNKVIIDTIRMNDKQAMKKLFNILNDIYENGSGDVQGLIAVTILGDMNNDQTLIENSKEYMSDELATPVIIINKYLATSAGKKKKGKLLNPPPFKPKKEKKPGMLSQIMAGAGTPPMQM